MAGWHYRLDGHEFEQAPGVGDGQGSLACYSPWGRKESDATELNSILTEWGVQGSPERRTECAKSCNNVGEGEISVAKGSGSCLFCVPDPGALRTFRRTVQK